MDASHAADLELARRCAAGEPAAWDRFVLEYRPVLYRAADALDRSGGARELADSLYAELYGIKDADRERQSLFRYFNGRSSLATWLRAVLAQRYVDRLRAQRRLEPLPPEDRPEIREPPDPERARYVGLVGQALGRAVGRRSARRRLRALSGLARDACEDDAGGGCARVVAPAGDRVACSADSRRDGCHCLGQRPAPNEHRTGGSVRARSHPFRGVRFGPDPTNGCRRRAAIAIGARLGRHAIGSA